MKKDLAIIWCELNSWKTPKRLEGYFDPSQESKDRSVIMKFIEGVVGIRYLLIVWNENYLEAPRKLE